MDEEERVREKIDKEASRNRGRLTVCRTRTDTLATPSKRLILALYKDHAYHLSRERVELIKQKLQEMYAMTPEETEKYFEEMREKTKKIEARAKLRKTLKKQYLKQKRREKEAAAFCFVEQLFKSGMRFAFRNPVPPLVSIRLRNLSDIILEQLCDLRNISKPCRDNPDQVGSFMINISDWFAIAIEHIYYMVQLKKNKELEEIEKQKELDKTKSTSISTKTSSKILTNPYEMEGGFE
ncbi:uncharacterized protein LOC130894849 [Diorhabda carinulata]|uniref:uncharacterized protein LOC130894849 n=1 Tax=Diorhabda carinulata TaxID=1163345 RepID=UPI0025A03332|nr:uncharacterized protein LOC130894849 [Diorhabda carinulata]